jgi:hypothetical protein
MFRLHSFAGAFAFLCTIFGVVSAPVSAETGRGYVVAQSDSGGPPLGIDATTYGVQRVEPSEFNGDVRDLPLYVRPQALHHWNEFEEPESEKPVVPPSPSQPNIALAPMPAPIQNFDGLSFTQTVTGGQAGAGFPPDVNGDVGPNHYIQAVNDAWAIYSKTGTLLAAFTENALWLGAGTGTPCDSSNFGDPVVLHDALADRWILTNFAFTTSGGNPVAPFYQCFAVSKSSDPVAGGWWLYAVRMDPGGTGLPPVGYLNDYPKFGVWTDCLYMATNEFQMPAGAYRGVAFGSFNRADLFAGHALTSSNSSLGFLASSNVFSMLPSNLLGTSAGSLPPAGTPNYFVYESQTAFAFDVRKFTPGAGCGAGGTLGNAVSVSQSTYSDPGQNIVPQPPPATSGNNLDSLGDRLMQKAQYRKIGSAESLWVVHTVRGAGSGTARPQWAEINVSGGNVSTTAVQQQIYAPDATLYRWMGALAVDRLGNMALGYATSNASSPNFPSIAYSGRLVGDPLNNLSQTETVLVQGAGSQVNTCGGAACHRWGDYSSMSIDPTDDCTFWYTNEYYDSQTSGNSGNWHTRIGSFRFPSCTTETTTHTVTPSVGTPSGTIAPSTPQTVDDGDTTSFTLTPSSGFEIASVGGTCGGTLVNNVFTTDPVTEDCTVIANFAPIVVTHTVTPSVGTPSGTIAPSTPQTVDDGDTTSFTLTPSSGFQVAGVGGTCGGSLVNTVFMTNPVTADCTVIANFIANPLANVTPATLSFSVAFGGSASDVLHVANNGGATLTWSMTEATANCTSPSDVPWVDETPTSGSVAGAASQNSTVDVDAVGLTAGNYSAHLCVTTNDPTHTLIDVPVSLAVAAAPVAPTVAKAFAPGSVLVNTDSVLTLTLGNSNASAATLTSALTDTFPSGLVVSTSPNASTTCPNGSVTAQSGQGSFSLASGAQIPPNGTCTAKVNVRSSTAGNYVNTIPAGALVTDKGSNASAASATLIVTTPIAPTLAKAFSPEQVAVGADSTLVLTLGNTNAVAATLTSALTDTFPTGLVVSTPANASTTCAGGSVTAQAGQGSFSLSSGAQIPVNGSCTVNVSVHSATAGNYVNTIPAGALATDRGTNASPASATLTVTALPVAPTLSKAFSPSSVTAGSPSHLTLTLGNANTSAATLLAGLVDTLPSGLVVATPANASTTCPNGTVGATSGGTTITLNTPAEIPANGSCTVGVDVASDDAGTYVNTIAAGALHTTLGDNAAPASATLIVTPVENNDRIFCDGFDGVACVPLAAGAANPNVAPKAVTKHRRSVGDRRLR